MRRSILLAIVLLLMLPATIKAETYQVRYTNQGFNPPHITISVNDSVRFTNNSTYELHIVSSPTSTHPDKDANNIGLIEKGTGLGIMTFSLEGEHTYINQHNPEHRGTITITSLAPSPTPPPSNATTTIDGQPIPTPRSFNAVMTDLNQKVLGIRQERTRKAEAQAIQLIYGLGVLVITTFAMVGLYFYTKHKSKKPATRKPTLPPNPKDIFSKNNDPTQEKLSQAEKELDNWLKKAA